MKPSKALKLTFRRKTLIKKLLFRGGIFSLKVASNYLFRDFSLYLPHEKVSEINPEITFVWLD
jgi:hypothetical protein